METRNQPVRYNLNPGLLKPSMTLSVDSEIQNTEREPRCLSRKAPPQEGGGGLALFLPHIPSQLQELTNTERNPHTCMPRVRGKPFHVNRTNTILEALLFNFRPWMIYRWNRDIVFQLYAKPSFSNRTDRSISTSIGNNDERMVTEYWYILLTVFESRFPTECWASFQWCLNSGISSKVWVWLHLLYQPSFISGRNFPVCKASTQNKTMLVWKVLLDSSPEQQGDSRDWREDPGGPIQLEDSMTFIAVIYLYTEFTVSPPSPQVGSGQATRSTGTGNIAIESKLKT